MNEANRLSKTLNECAYLVRETVAPDEALGSLYIGLEHIGEDTLSLIGYGKAEDVTSTKYRFQKGDILFGKLRPYFRKVIRAPFDGVCSTDIWVVRAKSGIDQGYLFYWMASKDFIDEATRGSEGTKMPRANWEFVSRFRRQVPSLKEQQAIAHILCTLDDKIELNKRMNETLEAIARAIFKSWFVDFDPVRAKAEGRDPGLPKSLADLFPGSLDDSAIGKVPSGWQIKGLDEIAHFLNGLALQKYPPKNEDAIPIIKIAQLRAGHSKGADKASIDIPQKYVIDDGDVLFSWSGSLEARIWCGGRGALNQHIFKVTSKKYPKWFYYLWILQHLPNFRGIASGKTTTMGHIQRRHLSEAKIVEPPHTLIRKCDALMSGMIDRAINCSLEARHLSEIRDALLPKLISGELRVKDVDRFLDMRMT